MAEKKRRGRRTALIVAGSVLLVLILVGAGLFFWATRGLGGYAKMTVKNVDISKVPDGTYEGGFDGGRFSNTVRVTILDHKITDIAIVKDVTFKMNKVSRLFDRVIKAQSLKVDSLTGATVTSKAFLKSIESALSGAR